MKPGHFILNGQSSEAYGIVIQDRPRIDTPKRRVEFKRAYGQSGEMPFDEQAYDNTDMKLSMYVQAFDGRTASDNRDLVFDLFDSGTYMDFIPYFDPNKIYKVMTTSPPSFESKYYMGEGQAFEVDLTVKPFKYYVPDPNLVILAPSTIINLSSKLSYPVFKIYGTGDITLTVDGLVDHVFVMQDIVDHIYLDCELGLAYKDVAGVLTSQNANTYTRKYPYLTRGPNTISWTGTVTKIEIEPRWRTLA